MHGKGATPNEVSAFFLATSGFSMKGVLDEEDKANIVLAWP